MYLTGETRGLLNGIRVIVRENDLIFEELLSLVK